MNGAVQKEKYLRAFLTGFFMMAIIFVPFLILDKGLFIYYGDYNAQQIPFYQMVHDAVRSGNFGWDWQTDLGTNLIGSYSFYLFGSPFFWLTIPFPSDWVPYMMPFLMCLKYGIATLTSYAYIRRFVKSTNVALIGAIIYAFSGFSAYNIFFNHFHDIICFFPLVLIALEEAVVNNRKGCFALAVALISTINYYFFVGQVVFLIFYFILRLIFSKEFKLTFSKFISLAFESLIGFGISAVIVLPSVLMVLGNPRVGASRFLLGWRMVYYGYGYQYLSILESLFFVPDIPARPNFFPLTTDKWSSLSAYLPLFSMAGVITFFAKKKKHWIKPLLLICAFCAFVPFLNSMFQLFNSVYYARWFYMPVLIMALATAIVIDQNGFDLKFGIGATAFMTIAFSVIGLLPSYAKDANGDTTEQIVFGQLPKYADRFWGYVAISIAALFVLAFLYRIRKNKKVMCWAMVFTCVFAMGSTFTVMVLGRSHGPKTKTIKEDYLYQTFDLEEEENQFYRIDTYSAFNNANMYWGYSNMQSFHSIIPAASFEFYDSINAERMVNTTIDYSYYGLRGLASVKYHIRKADSSKQYKQLPGFEYIGKQGVYEIYENKYYIPMGFTYDYYFDKEQLGAVDEKIDALYVEALYLTDEQIEKYSKYMEELPLTKKFELTHENYLTACERLQKTACHYFKYDNYGFTAKATVSDTNLMVFSVLYDSGWSATVNGKSVEIEKVQNGFMAVLVPEGEVDIRFTYQTPGLKLGLIITLACILLFILYLVFWKILKKVRPDKFATNRYAHLNLFETVSEVELKNEYILDAASEEIGKKEEKTKKQSADFLHIKPKAINAFRAKKVEEAEPEIDEIILENEEEILSEETRKALENLGGIDEEENK